MAYRIGSMRNTSISSNGETASSGEISSAYQRALWLAQRKRKA